MDGVCPPAQFASSDDAPVPNAQHMTEVFAPCCGGSETYKDNIQDTLRVAKQGLPVALFLLENVHT